ncbi:MAG TPA: hypothetical protein VIH30_00605 [Aquirhabdus sp.]
MKTQIMLLKNIAMTIALASTFAMLGCQKQDSVQEEPEAAESAAQAAQAAQAATDAAYAAAPAADDAALIAIATANYAAASAPVVTATSS